MSVYVILLGRPLDVKLVELGHEVTGSIRPRPGHEGTDLQLPSLAALVPKDPANLPQRNLLTAILRHVVHPEAHTVLILARVDADGDGGLTFLDLLLEGEGGQGGDAPVGPGVATDGGQAGEGVVELDAGLDPFAGGGRGGGVGEG